MAARLAFAFSFLALMLGGCPDNSLSEDELAAARRAAYRASPEHIALGDDVSRTLASMTAPDVYYFTSVTGTTYVLTLTPTRELNLELWTPDDSNLVLGGLNERIEWTADATGRCFVHVWASTLATQLPYYQLSLGEGVGGATGGGGSSSGGTSGGSSTLTAPTSPSPSNGAQNVALREDAQGSRSIVELDWAPVASASRYVVNISRSSSIPSDSLADGWSSQPGNETGGTSASDYTFVILSSQYRYSTTYYWRVTAYNADRTRSVKGPIWSFTTESSSSGGPGAGSQSNFEPGTYQGLVVQESEIFSDGDRIDTDERSTTQSITFNSQGLLGFNMGDRIPGRCPTRFRALGGPPRRMHK